MRKLICIVTVVLLGICHSYAQTGQLDGFLEAVSTKRVSCNYKFTLDLPEPVIMTGFILIQQDCYYINANDTQIYADGRVVITVNNSEKEVTIEKAYPSNSVSYWLKTFGENTYDLSFEENSFKGTYVFPRTGTELNFIIMDIQIQENDPDITPFSYDTESLSSDWIVTDIR